MLGVETDGLYKKKFAKGWMCNSGASLLKAAGLTGPLTHYGVPRCVYAVVAVIIPVRVWSGGV